MNSLPVSGWRPRSGKGSCSRIRSTAATIPVCPLPSTGIRSVQPVARSTVERVYRKVPTADSPLCDTRSISR